MRRGLFLSGLASAAVLARADAQGLPAIRLGLAEGDDATPSLYALQTGLFKKYGLNVQLIKAPNGAQALAALAGGSLDIAGTSLLPFFSAVSRGLPLQLVAPLALSTADSEYAVILVKKDAPYRTGRDFNGKTIASSALKDLNWLATMAWIRENGGDIATVRAIEMPASAIPAALQDARIDAATVTTPRYVQALAQGGVRVLARAYQAIAKRFLFAGMASRTEWADKNAAAVARFGEAIRDATLFANAHHAETVETYAGFAHIDPKVIAGAPRSISAPYLDAKEMEPLIAAAVRYRVLDKPLDPERIISPAALRPRPSA